MFTLTPYVLRNMFSKKATRKYPYQKRKAFNDVRGELINNIEKCTFCSACALKCPSQCIKVDRENAIWTCEASACVFCGICVDTCPTNSLYQKPEHKAPFVSHQIISMKGELKKKPKPE
jgi:ech hydrogenase subunit F